ncbi:MAG: alpha-amylase [Bacteroidales bacterium]|nr:alpha-amylase [Bacteroidales bacterium]
MTKKYHFLLFAALSAALMLAVSCGEPEQKEPDTLSVSLTELSFTAEDASTKLLSIKSNTSWVITASADWIILDKTSGSGNAPLAVKVSPNTGDDREGTISVKGAQTVTVKVTQSGNKVTDLEPLPVSFDGNKRAGTIYQLLVYSFADSDGNGIGDFNGIASKLDYLDEMGVSALWLSPIHPAMSYHGYDVKDYYSVNPEYGTEEDFKNLLAKAKAKGIDIYLDYVLNHAGKDHPWFQSAKASETSPYRNYFIFSTNPAADISAGKLAMFPKNGYDSGQWFSCVSGSATSMKVKFTLTLDAAGKPKTLKIEQVDEISNSGTPNSGIWLYYGDGKMSQFYTTGGSVCTLSIDISSSWGVLVRTSQTQWDSYKYGAPSSNHQLEWGKELPLSNTDAADILLPGMDILMYHSHFWTDWFADFNYGPASTSETSPAFVELAASADKWINMGVQGLRLDAVKHIYWNEDSDENPTFLDKWYQRCNATYKAAGNTGNIYMVGEVFSEASKTFNYYKGLPSVFEFSFWWGVKDALNNRSAGSFVNNLISWRSSYTAKRADAVPAIKLTNHDENRAASDLGKSEAKEKQAAAILLTAEGRPVFYQGEELGYWGVKDGGDEYVRTPMKWTKTGTVASGRLGGKVDNTMLTASISVEAQEADTKSLMNVYKTFSKVRNAYPALASGKMSAANISGSTILAWYMTSSDGQKVLVIHNVASSAKTVAAPGDLSKPIAVLGSAALQSGQLVLEANSSVVFLQ